MFWVGCHRHRSSVLFHLSIYILCIGMNALGIVVASWFFYYISELVVVSHSCVCVWERYIDTYVLIKKNHQCVSLVDCCISFNFTSHFSFRVIFFCCALHLLFVFIVFKGRKYVYIECILYHVSVLAFYYWAYCVRCLRCTRPGQNFIIFILLISCDYNEQRTHTTRQANRQQIIVYYVVCHEN